MGVEGFLIAAAVGVGIGVLSGMLGIGGGTIMVPVFRLAFGLAPIVSTATSLFTIIPTSVAGAVSHVRARTCLPRLGIALGLGGSLASPLGAWLSSISPGWAIMLAAAIIIGYSAITMFTKALRMTKPSEKTQRETGGVAPTGADAEREPRAAEAAEAAAQIDLSRMQLAKAACIGMAAGLASGYVGLGGGFLMVPLMVSLFDLPMKLASGTSLVAVMMLAVPGSIAQIAMGNVDFAVACATALGAIPGALVGARLVNRVPERSLRLLFGLLLLVSAILLVVRG